MIEISRTGQTIASMALNWAGTGATNNDAEGLTYVGGGNLVVAEERLRKVAWIHADQAKAGRDIHVSPNETALNVLRQQIGKHPDRVFTFRGKPIVWASSRACRKALAEAELTDFRWHDLRHTWASWLAQSGVPLGDIQEMGAWESAEMVRRYAHLAGRTEVVDKLLGTDSAQS